ncbi:MAG: hypothetical protein KC731_16890 [Myxococcales bacterium]|nr:hypothetical protein [Myxococcales bacterium]
MSQPAPELQPAVEPRDWAIVSPGYDALWFLAPPTVAVVTGILLTRWDQPFVHFAGRDMRLGVLCLGALTQAHLVIVLLRSHGNAAVRRRHPVRFFAVPALLLAAMLASPWILVAGGVVATFWDVYHSALQTFGLGRIYDQRVGNDPQVGRRLDIGLNLLLYAGPIAAGATLVDHLASFREFEQVGDRLLTRVPAYVMGRQAWLTWAVVIGGTLFVIAYLGLYVRHARRGYRVAPAKVFLFATTGLCSIYTWGFNSWGQAFLVMNLFHAVQYFALVWWAEGGRWSERLRLDRGPVMRGLAWAAFTGGALAYGFGAQATYGLSAWYAVTLVIALMHFWYDGFIWSVRRGEV